MNAKAIISFVIAVASAIPVNAQNTLEEVIVTAQRREQNLQDVPVSVTAFSGAGIEQNNIRAARDYLQLTPNVAFTDDGQTGSKGVGLAIRGVGNLVSGENATVNSVGIYLDGFSIASVPNQVANPALPDMASIEILRGPQGTFFGRNSVGGALNLRSNEPSDEFGFKVIIGGESYQDANEMYNVTTIVNAPVSETFRLRGVLMVEDSEGRVENVCAAGASAAQCPVAAENGVLPNGTDNSGYDEVFARLKAVWDISDETTIKASLTYSDANQGHDENVPTGILDVDTVDSFGVSTGQDCGTGFYPDNRNKVCHDLDERNENEALIAVFTVEHQLNDNLKLTAITGLIDAENSRFFDNDLIGGADLLRRTNFYEGTSWSSELRFDHTSDSFDWTIGVLYSKDDQEQENNVEVASAPTSTVNGVGGFLPPFPEGLGLARNSKDFEIEEQALFADITWHVAEKLDLIAGGRYTRSQVDNTIAGIGNAPGPLALNDPDCAAFFAGMGPPCANFFPSFINFPRPVSSADKDFIDFAPRLGARFQITDETNLYTMISKGYKPGGNSVGNDTNSAGEPAIAVPYEKETLWNYELGVKSVLLEGRLRLNAAIFHLDWSDLQFESFFFLTPGDLGSLFEQTINIEEARADGLELEFVALVDEGLTISGGLGYLDSEITSDTSVRLSGGWTPSLQGLELPKAPKLTANLVGEYRWTVGEGEAWIQLEYIHRDGQYSDIEGVTNRQLNGPAPNNDVVHSSGPGEFPYRSPDYDLINLRAGYETGPWNITAYVQNLTDEEYYTGTQENFGINGIRVRPNPTTIGASFSYSFGGI